MVDSVMLPGKMSNCEEDVDQFLFSLQNVSTHNPEIRYNEIHSLIKNEFARDRFL